MGIIDVMQLQNMKGVKIVHINARSMYNKLTDIASNFYFCDIIVITETWLTKVVPTKAIDIDGFNVIRQDREVGLVKKGGGICIYIKKDCLFDKIDDNCVIF